MARTVAPHLGTGARWLLLFCLVPSLGQAQPTTTFDALRLGILSPGDTVIVTDTTGVQRGVVSTISSSALEITVATRREGFDASEVRAVRKTVRRTGRMALVGLAAGAGVTALVTNQDAAILFGVIGAGAGAAIGSGIRGQALVYLAPHEARPDSQASAGRLAHLALLAIPGERVRVTDRSGATQKGTLIGIRDSVLSITVDDAVYELPERELVEVVQYDSLTNGIGAGVVIGGVMGLLGGALADFWEPDAGEIGMYTVAGAGIGAAIGAGLDALIGGRTLFRAAAPARVDVAASPLLSNGATGVRLSLRF
jgi:hypothetical protein